MFHYSLANVPWLFTSNVANKTDKDEYEKKFPVATRRMLNLLRQCTRIHPDAIIAPELGLMTAAELALLWIQKKHLVRLAEPNAKIRSLTPEQQASHKLWQRKKDTLHKRALRAKKRHEREATNKLHSHDLPSTITVCVTPPNDTPFWSGLSRNKS